ncbi:nucleoside-diphosphate kinase [Candidatus Gracilibacteria bacterium 28_42_T64]|nr:nucleoside-diphosphate kinase [Candidatus Gracilibacteria bacterium 28_42_T64]
METTLILLKPDTIERSLIGQVIARLEAKGLKITGLKMMQLDDAIIEEHYDFLMDKPFFPNIKKYMTRTPIVAIAAKGANAIATVRMLTGATNPVEALPGSIRGDLALSIDANIIHASDTSENAEIELNRFFKGTDIFTYNKLTDEVL